jgi:hypothetical protein
MGRFFFSLLVALILGALIGLYIGWVQFPAQTIDSPASALAQRYKDEYTVMVAEGYRADSDLGGALERLRLLSVENIPAYVQETAERFITNSRDLEDIRALVLLAEGVGRLTPIMQPYRPLGGGS